MMGGKGTKIILLLSALMSLCHGVDWIGAGNWTADNLTALWGRINAIDTSTQLTRFAFVTTLSDDLNRDWQPAWNVVLSLYTDNKNYDSVLYGYGFNEHWFWVNGMKTTSSNYYSIVIWKDFNCIKWWTFNGYDSSPVYWTFSPSIYQTIAPKIVNTNSNRDLADIWKVAQDIQSVFPQANGGLFQDKLAYSVVALPTYDSKVQFKVCAKDYDLRNRIGYYNGTLQGIAIIFQMRDS